MKRDARSVFLLRNLGQGSLVVLAAVLPFELVRPVAPLGPLQLSSVELFLYASVGLWMAASFAAWSVGRTLPAAPGALASTRSTARRWRWAAWWRQLPEAHRAAAAWSLALLLSAVFAPLARAAATKFALRSLGGVMLSLAVADLLDSRRAVWRCVAALGAGAVVAALLMACEVDVRGFAPLLLPFHAHTFGVLGLARASGPFQYPNIASMYLEAALPVALAAGVVSVLQVSTHRLSGRPSRPYPGDPRMDVDPLRARRLVAVTALAGLAIIYALVLAASRAGLATALLSLIGIAAISDRPRVMRRLALALAGGLVAITIVAQAVSPMLALRLRFWQSRPWYGSVIEVSPEAGDVMPAQIAPSTEVVVGLSVKNVGAVTWPTTGKKPVKVSYHWTSEDGRILYVLDGARTVLPRDVPPDDEVQIAATVRAPDRPGRYVLWWDLVREGVAWFSDVGDEGRRQRVAVGVTSTGRKGKLQGARMVSPPAAFDSFSRKDLWRAGLLAFWDHPLLGLGPDNFRRAYGHYLARKETDERLHANNFYIEVMATLGLVGLAALAGLVVTLARTARRAFAVHPPEGGPATRVLALGTGVALATYFIHGTFDYFLEFTPTYALFWLLAGVLVALDRIAQGSIASEDPR